MTITWNAEHNRWHLDWSPPLGPFLTLTDVQMEAMLRVVRKGISR